MKKKRIIIPLVIASSLVVLYFGLGILGMAIAANGFINVRNCDPNLLEEDFYRIQKCRPDYESLKDREEITFSCGKETLMGYLYQNPNPKGVIVFAHGIKNNADANAAQMHDYYLNHGYDVFSFDLTGCGRSTGKGIRTLYESRNCVKYAVETVKELKQTKDLPIFVIGHSWGAYGAVVATDDVEGVSAVAAFSAFNRPDEMIYATAEINTSKAMVLAKPSMLLGVATIWGNKASYQAETSIKNHPDIPYVILQGDLDTVVPYKEFSLYDNIVNDHYQNVTTIKLEGIHHGAPWKTVEAETYTGKCEKELKELREKYHNNLPDVIREQYIAKVDKNKSSAVNEEVLSRIDTIFTNAIK